MTLNEMLAPIDVDSFEHEVLDTLAQIQAADRDLS